MNPPQTGKSGNGVSSGIKIFVVVMTVITAVTFAVFFYKVAGKITSSSGDKPWALELRAVGDKLKDAGLHRQAVVQYAKFLEYEDIDLKTRAVVAQTLGGLYKTLGECGPALSWFYQAEAAGPDPDDKQTLEAQIAACLKEVKSARP